MPRPVADDTNRTFTSLSRDIRLIKNSKSILTADENTLTFDTISNETISFFRSERILVKSVSGNNYQLADNISALNFSYYDASSNIITTPITGTGITTDIRYIDVNLALGQEAANITLNMRIRPRNIRGS